MSARRAPEAPTTLTAMAWLSLGPDIAEVPNAGQAGAGSQEVLSLRERIAEQYSTPSSTDRRLPPNSVPSTGRWRSHC